MRTDGSRPQDADRLADGRVELQIEMGLATLPRLAPQLARPEGTAVARVAFSREFGLPVAVLRVAAQPALVCQRCMGAVVVPLSAESRIALVDDLAKADLVPAGIEPVLIEAGRVVPRDLVEEELLLALPLVPRHAEGDSECRSAEALSKLERVELGAGAPADTQRPFAELGELLKRGK